MDKKTPWNLYLDGLPRMSKEEWVLLILAQKKKEKGSHGAALMNDVFFFLKEFAPSVEEEFGFRGTGFGPFSKGVSNAVNKLISDELITIQKNEPSGINHYTITEKGIGRYESILEKIPKSEQGGIVHARFLSQSMGNMGTLQYLCSVYPEYVFIETAGDAPV